MKKLKSILALTLLGLVVFSCNKEEVIQPKQQNEVSKEVLQKLSSLSFNTSDVKLIKNTQLDGTVEDAYLIEGDIIMTKDQLFSMDLHGGITTEQYRTNNLVSAPRTIRIVGLNSGSSGLTANMRSGLQTAVNRYNNLGLSINFTLTFTTNTTGADIVVRRRSGSAGGSAGFPSGGRPFNSITIFSGLDTASVGVNSQVAGHEIGHCIGLRHTDWFSRQSCGGATQNEGDAGIGAVLIPGTPSGFDPTSYMKACFSFSDSGAFNGNDVTALNFLY